MARTVNILDAEIHLENLVHEIQSGSEREIIIAIAGKPCAKLVPFEQPQRVLGFDLGLIHVSPEFDKIDNEIARLFNGD